MPLTLKRGVLGSRFPVKSTSVRNGIAAVARLVMNSVMRTSEKSRNSLSIQPKRPLIARFSNRLRHPALQRHGAEVRFRAVDPGVIGIDDLEDRSRPELILDHEHLVVVVAVEEEIAAQLEPIVEPLPTRPDLERVDRLGIGDRRRLP